MARTKGNNEAISGLVVRSHRVYLALRYWGFRLMMEVDARSCHIKSQGRCLAPLASRISLTSVTVESVSTPLSQCCNEGGGSIKK